MKDSHKGNVMKQDRSRPRSHHAPRIGIVAGKDAEEISVDGENMPYLCQQAFGGTMDEWHAIYYGVTDPDEIPTIERALMLRTLEAVQLS